jgi:hypothetical protein
MSSTTTEGAIKAAEAVAGVVMMMDISREVEDGAMMVEGAVAAATGGNRGLMIGAGTGAEAEGSMMEGITMTGVAGAEAIMMMAAAEGVAGADTILAGVSCGEEPLSSCSGACSGSIRRCRV